MFALLSVSCHGASLVFANERLQYFDDAEVTHLSVTGLLELPRCYSDNSCLDFPSTFEMRCLEYSASSVPCISSPWLRGVQSLLFSHGNEVLCQHQKLSMPPHENLVSDKWLRHLTGAGRPTLGTSYPRGQPRIRIICLFLWFEFMLRGAPNKTASNGWPV